MTAHFVVGGYGCKRVNFMRSPAVQLKRDNTLNKYIKLGAPLLTNDGEEQ